MSWLENWKAFRKTHNGSQDRFYEYLVTHLFSNQLHLATQNTIIFARRGNKTKQHALRAAVEKGIQNFRKKYSGATLTKVDIDTKQSAQEIVLQAADYVLWAVQRAFEKGEMRYFNYMRDKIEIVWDLYDIEKFKQRQMDNKESTIYDRRKNPFDIKKASPLS